MEPPTPTEESPDAPPDTEADVAKAADTGEEYFDDGAPNEEDENPKDDREEEVAAAPQARKEVGDDNNEPEINPNKAARQSSLEDEGEEMTSVKLTPVDYANQRQNLKDSLMGKTAAMAPPPLHHGNNNNGGNHVKFNEEPQSALHQDEYSNYSRNEGLHYDPHNHESALAAGSSPGGGNSLSHPAQPNQQQQQQQQQQQTTNRSLNPFKARKKNRIQTTTSKDGPDGTKARKGHSHPRKTPYRSEIGRLRHAQQLEREKQQFQKGMDPEEEASNASTSTKSLGIRETTAPPDTAFFSIQSAKFKHSLLHSLGEFLTSAFADDEEASGSYFSQDLLDQISNNSPHVRGVWLQAKNLNDDHVRQLCEALLRNRVVTEVWLPSNQITDAGCGHIAHMLKFNKHIKELFLGENDIGPKGAAALASALARGNSTLVALGLGDNHIGVEGAGAFAAALRHNHALHTLDIKNNGIPKKSSIRGLLNKMLEFNASDPGDESLVLGLQEELANLVASLPPEMAESVVLQAEEALKTAMLCRKRGDKVGAAEAEGVFIRICTTGEPPVDPPEEHGTTDRRRRDAADQRRRAHQQRKQSKQRGLEPGEEEEEEEKGSRGLEPSEHNDEQGKKEEAKDTEAGTDNSKEEVPADGDAKKDVSDEAKEESNDGESKEKEEDGAADANESDEKATTSIDETKDDEKEGGGETETNKEEEE